MNRGAIMQKEMLKGDVSPQGNILPFDCVVLEEPETVKNPFSGESVQLQPDAVAVYDCIKGAEMMASQANIDDGVHPLWQTVRDGCVDYVFRQLIGVEEIPTKSM